MSDNRTALVTGANQGVGLQVARELIANGLTVLPLLRESPDARIVNVSSGVGSLTTNADSAYPSRTSMQVDDALGDLLRVAGEDHAAARRHVFRSLMMSLVIGHPAAV